VTTNIYGVSNTSWTDTSLTFNNRPSAGTTPLGSIDVAGTSPQWKTVNLTTYAQQQRAAGQTTIAIALRNPADALPYSGFGSRESGARAPQLFIE